MARAEEIPGEQLMAYLDGEMAPAEARAFEQLLEAHPEWREEVEHLSDIVDVTRKLHPRIDAVVWDGYWEEIDSRLTKRFGWALAAAGGCVLLLWGFIKILLYADNNWVRTGLVLLVLGGLVLFGAVIRGRLAELSRDRYRRIRR